MSREKKSSTYIELMENTFKLMRWSGHWFPTNAENPKIFLSANFYRSVLFISTLPLQIVPCVIDLILKIPDMPKVIMNSVSTVYSLHTLFRVIFTIVMGKSIRKIFEEFEKCKVPLPFLLLDDKLGKDATRTAFESSNKLFLLIIIGANVTGCLFTVTPFVISYEARIQKLQGSFFNGTIPHVLVYDAWYPFDISEFPIYQLTILFQAFCGFIWINMISTSDAMFLAVIIRMAGEFDVLKNMLLALSDIESPKIHNKSQLTLSKIHLQHSSIIMRSLKWPEDANILLDSWINYHQLVLRTLTLVRNTFSIFVFGVVGWNAVSLVFLAYVGATIKDLTALLSIISFLFVVMVQLSSFSYYSVKLTSKADEMSQKLLYINWWEAPASYQTSLKLISLRTSEEVTMSGMGYFDLNLELFLAIVKSASSYFMILLKVTSETDRDEDGN